MKKDLSAKKEQKKIDRIHRELLKLNKKLEKIGTDMSALSLDNSVADRASKEGDIHV